MTQQRCPKCERDLLPNADFCHHCGLRLEAPTPVQPARPTPATGQAGPQPSPVQAPPPRRVPGVDSSGRLVCPKCKNANRAAAVHCRMCGTALEVRNAAHPGALVASATGVHIGSLAGFWVRLAAYAIDTLVLVIPTAFIAIFFDTEPVFAGISRAQYVGNVVGLLYFVVGWSMFGTTFGKRLFNLYVVRPDGSIPSAGRALLRQFATVPSVLLLGLGYIMIGMRPDKRALHDLIADTYVIIKAP